MTAISNFPNIFLFLFLVALVLAVVYFIWKKRFSGFFDRGINNGFVPPQERAIYIAAKNQFDLDDPNQLEELKKLLMRRAIKTIPIIIALQNEGQSIERLYKRGMLTDHMHYKVKEMKAFLDSEIYQVQSEANELHEDWGTNIWSQAFQFHHMIQKHAAEKENDSKSMADDKKQLAAEKRKEKIKKQKEVIAARKKLEQADKIAQELLQEESQSSSGMKNKTK